MNQIDVNVRGEIFVLTDPGGRIRSAATTLDSVTRTLIEKEMPTPMWNGIFGNSSPEARENVYADFGWRVNGISYLTTNAGIAERDEYDTPLYTRSNS